MNRFYRAFFECSGDRTSNLTVDLLLNPARHVVPRVPCCGWWGRLKSNDMWPFAMTDGELDFGDTDGEESSVEIRYGVLDITDRIVAVDETFELYYAGSYYLLTLKKLTDVAEL